MSRNPQHIRKAFASLGDDTTLSRFVKVPNKGRKGDAQPLMLDSPRAVAPRLLNRPAVAAGRSIFHAKGVKPVDAMRTVLVSGHSNVKIGRDVRKGWLRGYWIYTLSLEERATCHHWATCYGNNMPYAKRVDHRDQEALQQAIARDVRQLLAVRGRRGILIRLHALGDFFDESYVWFWSELVRTNPKVTVYGYTARPPESEIGRAIAAVKRAWGRRFAIRWSNGGDDEDCTVPVRTIDEAVNAIVCPEQTGATAACATCGLCWGTRRNIAFLEH